MANHFAVTRNTLLSLSLSPSLSLSLHSGSPPLNKEDLQKNKSSGVVGEEDNLFTRVGEKRRRWVGRMRRKTLLNEFILGRIGRKFFV